MAQNNHIERISENIGRTDEGYLVCRNAVIARTGFQKYKVGELSDYIREKVVKWFPNLTSSDEVEFYRSPAEVFSPSTRDTFEGKALTDEHPPELINSENHAEYNCGHMANVRKGTVALDSGDWPLLADIYITVDEAIAKYESGVRELSCGYTYDVVKEGSRIFMVDLRGNHVALVPKGRAGSEVCINDAAPIAVQEFKIMDRNDLISLGIANLPTPEERRNAVRIALDAAAKDADEETEAEKKAKKEKEAEEKSAKDAAQAKDAEDKEKSDKAAKDAAIAKDAEMTDEKAMEAIEAVRDRLDDIEEAVGGDDEDEGEATDEASEEAKKEMVGSSKDAIAKDALDDLRAIKPFVAKSRDHRLRRAFDSQMKRALPSLAAKSGGGYEAFARGADARSRAATDSLEKKSTGWVDNEASRATADAAFAKRNPHTAK